MRRGLTALVVGAAAVGVLAGCGLGATADLTAGPPVPTPSDITDDPAPASEPRTGIEVVRTVETAQSTVYLTIDDGQNRDPSFARWVSERRIPLSMFVVGRSLVEAPGYFALMDRAGSRIENHTMRHQRLTTLGAAAQKREICEQSAVVERLTGQRPTLFRPPYGAYNATTLRVAAVCGIDQVVLWSVSIRDGRVTYADGRDPEQGFRAGDVVLLHFSKQQGIADVELALAEARKAGLAPALLPTS